MGPSNYWATHSSHLIVHAFTASMSIIDEKSVNICFKSYTRFNSNCYKEYLRRDVLLFFRLLSVLNKRVYAIYGLSCI